MQNVIGRRDNMKKRIFLYAIVGICLSVAISGTLAYFTDEEVAHNIITSGGVNIEVIEKTQGSNDVLVDFPIEGIKGVMPGKTVSKIVQVKNTGNNDAWIRINVESTITNSDGETLPLTIGENKKVIEYSVLDGWVDGGDGYYYFKTAVEPDQLTGELFKEVKFNPNMGNEYQNCTAKIIINAQAVQTANNPIPEDGSIKDIKGWPSNSEGENSVND